MRAIFLIFCLCVLGSAAPVIKGDVKLVRANHLKPPDVVPGGLSSDNRKRRHPCVVVSNADDNGDVKVAMLSHHHFPGVKTKPANDYAPFEKHPVPGGTSISVSPPKTVHVSNLKDATREPKIVEPDKLQNLIDDINKNCPPDQQLTGGQCRPMSPVARTHGSPEHSRPVYSSPQHGRPVHGRPDHGHPESSSDSGWQTVTRKGRPQRRGK